ncbi:MAG: hypothetical protein HGA19_20735, partial [Oscillochloris sp.]|nr:hypothetical protein [Oscillochloris sp.]
MKTVTFTITARQPLLLTSLQGDPNSSVSFDYVPGSMIRGALIACYQAIELNGKEFDSSDEIIRRRFFDHQTRFLNGYPLVADADDSRALPLLRSLTQKKNESDHDESLKTIYDLSVQRPDLDEDEQLSPYRRNYGTFTKRGRLVVTSVNRRVQIHNQRDRPRGRGVESSGAVFRYEAIAPDERFGAAVLCDVDADVDLFTKLLKVGTFWIGGSRSAGYGEAAISDVQIVDEWHETGTPPTRRSFGSTFRLILLSDLFARDVYGQMGCELPQADPRSQQA